MHDLLLICNLKFIAMYELCFWVLFIHENILINKQQNIYLILSKDTLNSAF